MITTHPLYSVECGNCLLLGIDELEDVPVDVYVCPQAGSPTIRIQYSELDADYTTWNFSFFQGDVDREDRSFQLAKAYYRRALESLEKEVFSL